jgi:hypothetical protein
VCADLSVPPVQFNLPTCSGGCNTSSCWAQVRHVHLPQKLRDVSRNNSFVDEQMRCFCTISSDNLLHSFRNILIDI